ncbi:hypothetical protein F66182_4750 [Fusarium sp. NRRL 66182]|nr:hypothetical protein F66182_4750 [Fusarium sp. NRRL 66182]
MDNTNHNYRSQAQEYRDNYTLSGADDTNIDPLLNVCTTAGPVPPSVSNAMDTQFLMNSAMWNPALNNPISFYQPGVPGMAPTTLTNSPKPPTEAQSSPRTPSSEYVFETSRTSSKSSIPSVNSVETDTKPRRSSRTAVKPQRRKSSVQSIPSPPRRRRAAKEQTVEEDDDEEEEDDAGMDDDSKRSKFLKRNRIAASKCRQKKKEWVSNLEDTRNGLEHENVALHKQYNGLIDELSSIKNQLMQHASCNDANINQWLDNEAKKFVQRIAAQNRAPGQSRPHVNTGNCCNEHRRGSSGKIFDCCVQA